MGFRLKCRDFYSAIVISFFVLLGVLFLCSYLCYEEMVPEYGVLTGKDRRVMFEFNEWFSSREEIIGFELISDSVCMIRYR